MKDHGIKGQSELGRRSFLHGGIGAGLLLVSGAGAATLLSGCSPSTAEQSGQTAGATATGSYMTAFGVNLSFVEAVVAKERGFFDEFGLDLDIKGGQGTASAIQAVLGGSVDLSRAHSINLIVAVANESAPLRGIGTVRQRSQFDLVSLAEKPIKNPSELEGKTVGVVSAAGSTENLLDMMLISAGVDPSTVERPVTGVGTAAYELAKTGEIDAWISVDTDRRLINEQMGPVHHFNSDEYVKIPSDTYCVSQGTIDSDSDVPARFLAGILKALEYASDEANWEQVVKDLQVYTPTTDMAASLANLPILVDGWHASGSDKLLNMDRKEWQAGQKSMAEAGIVDKAVSVDELIYTDYLDRAREMVNA